MDLDTVRDALIDKRADLSSELSTLTAVPLDPMGSVSFGKRIGDGTTEAVERLNTTGAARQISAMLTDVERALVKIDEASYGRCDRCGSTISPARLEARPWSVLCMDCSAAT